MLQKKKKDKTDISNPFQKTGVTLIKKIKKNEQMLEDDSVLSVLFTHNHE